MKKFRLLILLIAPMLVLTSAKAQNYCSAIAQKDYQKQYYSEFSRWSAGVKAGVSGVWGDFRSTAYDKTYFGFTTGLNVAYQVTPTLGIRLSGAYGLNKAGAAEFNKHRLVDYSGFTYNNEAMLNPQNFKKSSLLYSKIQSWTVGLNAQVNMNNLFAGNDAQTNNRKWTVLASPGFYMQYFQPEVFTKGDNSARYTTTDLFQSWQYGLGGDVALRYKAGRLIDLELSTTLIWVSNSNFDGIRSQYTRKANVMGDVSLGMIIKFGKNKKKDHLMYASTRNYVSMSFPEPVVIQKDTVVVEVPVEKIKIVEVKVKDLPALPTIHFERGYTNIDEQKYAQQLHVIVATLKEYKDAKIQIWGYADHTGTEQINDSISYGRAEAMRDYLVAHGIDASRIQNLVAMGKDPLLQGEEAFSEKARRAEIVKGEVE